MKQKLIARLDQMNKLVEQKKVELNQANANFNMLLGQQAELHNLVQAYDELQKPVEVPKPIEDNVVELDSCVELDKTCEAL